jgi:autophagy-related protein 9
MVIVYILLFTTYGIFSIQTFIKSFRSAIDSRYIFEEKLGISSRKLEGGAVEWHEVVEKICNLQASGEYRIAVSGEMIDPLSVAQRIMRRENFLIAMFNLGLINCTISLPPSCFFGWRSKVPFYSKTLEVCGLHLYTTLLT